MSDDPLDGIRKALEGNDMRKPTKKMTEAMILAKLFKDGLFVVDEEAKTAKIDMRKSILVERYKVESYEDILGIMQRTAKGLAMAGYEVETQWLESAVAQKMIKSTVDEANESLKN